jgi:hypothetical protein
MRKLRLKAEMPTQSHNALVFFALALDEQLYDYTDDSFKAPALNTFSRTLELQSVAQANHSAGISKEALRPFIEELEASIGKDAALSQHQKSLCKIHINAINDNIGEADRIARGISGLRIVMGDYFESIKQAIEENILENPREKKNLLNLTSTFIAQAEIIGYPKRHSYHAAQNSFIRHLKYESAFSPKELLDDFFSSFSHEEKNFECVFVCDGPYEKFPNLLKRFGIAIDKIPPDWEGVTGDQRSFLDSRKPEQFFATFRVEGQYSPAMAHKIAAAMIDEFIGTVRFYAHKDEFAPSKLALVRNLETNKVYRVHDAPDPMHCWVSHTLSDEQEMLKLVDVTHGRHLADAASNRLQRSIRLHRSALRSNSAENQLIDLWAALEGLVSRPGKESQRIEYFSECLLPCLTLCYPEKILTSAYSDVTRVFPESKAVIETLSGGDSTFSKFVRLVLCPQHKAAQANITELLIGHPLLLNKIFRISEIFKSRSEIQQTLRHHRQKVRWHLSRIYHTRNSIMHSATAMPYLPALVENLHVYIDTLIKSIQQVALISPERQTIDGILQYLSSWERYRLHTLTTDGSDNEAPLTDENVWDAVFGTDMALTPSQSIEPAIASLPKDAI